MLSRSLLVMSFLLSGVLSNAVRNIQRAGIETNASAGWCDSQRLGATCPQEGLTCGKSAVGAYDCLDWREVQCATDFDLGKGAKAVGTVCFNPGTGGSGKCQKATVEGLPDNRTRCVDDDVAECIGKVDGAACTRACGCTRPEGKCRVNNVKTMCLRPDVFECDGKTEGNTCKHLKEYTYKIHLAGEDSWCMERFGEFQCVESANGACVQKFKGQPCRPHTALDADCTNTGGGQCRAWNIVRETMEGGFCQEEMYPNRPLKCEGATVIRREVIGKGGAEALSVLLPFAFATLGAVLSL